LLMVRKFRCAMKLLRNVNSLLSVSRLGRMVNALALVIGLDKLGLLALLESPRSIEEIAAFIGDVKRQAFLEELLKALVNEGVLDGSNGLFRVNKATVKKLYSMRGSHPFFKGAEYLLAGFEEFMYEILVEVLRGASFDFVSPEVATLFYLQNSSPAYKIGREILLELGGGKNLKGKCILDLGCGFGVEPLTILEYLDFDCHLICADFFSNVVDECMHTMVEGESTPLPAPKPLKDLDNVEFVVLDPSMNTPFPLPDESVDSVFSFQLLHWSSYPQRIINECARVLRKGGTLMIATPLKDDNETTTIDVVVKASGGNRIYTESELSAFMEEAGLEVYCSFLSNFMVARKPNNSRK